MLVATQGPGERTPTESCNAGQLLVWFTEVVLLNSWESWPRTTIRVTLYRMEMGWSLLKVTAKLWLVSSVTALTLAGYTRGICSAFPTADNQPDHTNTRGSKALSWVAQGQILRHLDVTGCFSMVVPHCMPLCREILLQHHWEQPGHVLSICQGYRHPPFNVLGCWRDHKPWPDVPQALWILHTSSKPFLLLSWHFCKVPCYLMSAHVSV